MTTLMTQASCSLTLLSAAPKISSYKKVNISLIENTYIYIDISYFFRPIKADSLQACILGLSFLPSICQQVTTNVSIQKLRTNVFKHTIVKSQVCTPDKSLNLANGWPVKY